MKSKLMIASLLLAGACGANLNAQEKTNYYTPKWSDNIFVSVGGGLCLSAGFPIVFSPYSPFLLGFYLFLLLRPVNNSVYLFRADHRLYTSKICRHYPQFPVFV